MPTVEKFAKHLDAFNESDAVVFVFDTPILCDSLSPIELLDVNKKTHSYSYVFRQLDNLTDSLKKALRSKVKVKVKRETLNLIPTMLNSVRGSMVQHILTYVYSIKDTDQRMKHQKAILSWLFSDTSLDDLGSVLTELSGETKQCRAVKGLLEKFLTNADTVASLRAALAKITKLRASKVNAKTGLPQAVPYKKISAEFKVDAFDLRYLMKLSRVVVVGKSDFHTIYLKKKNSHTEKQQAKLAMLEDDDF